MITLSEFTRQQQGEALNISCDVEIDGSTQPLTFDLIVPENDQTQITARPEPFLLAMLIPAMERGEDIHVEGSLNETLLFQINTFVVTALSTQQKSLHPISITARDHRSDLADETPRGAFVGMSCGVDSLHTELTFSQPNVPPRYQLRALALFDAGSFYDTDIEKPRIAQKAADVAKRGSYPLYQIQSNMAQFYSGAFNQSSTLRHVACAYCLAPLFDSFLVSSTYDWPLISVNPALGKSIAATDPIVLPFLSTREIEFVSAGADVLRPDKIEQVIQNSPYLELLDPCTRPTPKRPGAKNCGSCTKCGLVLLVAERLGLLEQFRDTFDLDAFKRRRFRIFQRMYTSHAYKRGHGPAFRYLKHHGVKPPFGAYAIGTGYGLLKRILP